MGSVQFPKGENKNFKMDDVTDYGCAGRGTFDSFAPTLGKRQDHPDQLFFIWKKCINCALEASTGLNQIPEYKYDDLTDDCCEIL